MQKHWDTPTHARGTRLVPSTVSGDYARLLPECRDCTILHTILHIEGRVTTSKMQQPQDYKSPDWVPMSRVNISNQHGLQSQKSKKHQVDVEIDTGAGCNVMSLYKVHELFGQE